MMTEPPQPNAQTIIAIQKQEIDRLNDNRVYLMAIVEDIKNEAGTEIRRLTEENSALKAGDEMEKAEKASSGG